MDTITPTGYQPSAPAPDWIHPRPFNQPTINQPDPDPMWRDSGLRPIGGR